LGRERSDREGMGYGVWDIVFRVKGMGRERSDRWYG
jgi:hypothetical protein